MPGPDQLQVPQLPFAHLNLRRNPFGQFSVEERMQLADVEIGPWLDALSDPAFCLQFVGEKGFGKTTHLLALRAALPNSGYVHIPEGERAALPTGNPILIDEAQRLTLWQQMRLFRRRVPLILGTHFDFSQRLRRAGRIVKTVRVGGGTTPTRLHRILNSRIEWVRRDSGPIPRISLTTAQRLLQQHGPDIRSLMRDLYDTFQTMHEIPDVEM